MAYSTLRRFRLETRYPHKRSEGLRKDFRLERILRGNMIANRSKSYDAYNQVAVPSAGAKTPAGKDSANEKDALKAKHSVESVKDAKEVPDAAKKALDKQLGRGDGDSLGDATTHPTVFDSKQV